MGRWTQYDEDEYRLPEGMKRVGYDADTQQYTFKDTRSGSTWEGAPGCEFGRMTKVSAANTDYMYTGGSTPEGPRPGGSAWKLEQLAAKLKPSEKSSEEPLTPFLQSVWLVAVSVYRHLRTEVTASEVPVESKEYKDEKCPSRHHSTRRHILGHCTEPRYKPRRAQSLKSWNKI